MHTSKRALFLNWLAIIVVLIVGFVFIAIYISISGAEISTSSSSSFEEFYLEESKKHVKQIVTNHYAEIQYEKEQLEQRELEYVSHEIMHLAEILTSLDISEIEDDDERKRQAILLYEEVVAFDTEHLYFAVDMEGNLLRSGTDERIEGVDLYDAQDVNGVYYTREVLKAADQPEGLYVTYSWPKVKDGEPLEKTSFCYYLPEYDIIIGAGIYKDDIEEKLKVETFEHLQSMYENKTDYIFIASLDGIGIVQGNPDLIGADMSGIENNDGRNLHQMIIEASTKEGGDFITYTYRKKGTEELFQKISYVIAIEDWDVYMGMGFYTDELESVHEEWTDEFEELQRTQLLITIGILLVLAILISRLVQRGNHLQEEYMLQEEVVFSQLMNQVTEGIVILGGEGRLLYSNQYSEMYFSGNIDKYIKNNKIELPKVNDTVYKIGDDKEEVYYVEVISNRVQYERQDAVIYFIKNITAQYLEADRYQQISMIDELTGLPNRRALLEDFEELDLHDKKVVIGMIDLDLFKEVNDTYGHDIGDKVLVLLADTFGDRIRFNDKFYRYGGEEFVVMMDGLSKENAATVLTNINRTFSARCEDVLGFSQTFSGGLAMCELGHDLKDRLKVADKQLYIAKSNGRNMICY